MPSAPVLVDKGVPLTLSEEVEVARALTEISAWPWTHCNAHDGKCMCGLIYSDDGVSTVGHAYGHDEPNECAMPQSTNMKFMAGAPLLVARLLATLAAERDQRKADRARVCALLDFEKDGGPDMPAAEWGLTTIALEWASKITVAASSEAATSVYVPAAALGASTPITNATGYTGCGSSQAAPYSDAPRPVSSGHGYLP